MSDVPVVDVVALTELAQQAQHEATEDRRMAGVMREAKNRDVLIRRAEVTEALAAQVEILRAAVVEYESAISWGTTCLACSKVLDASIRDHERAESLSAKLAAVRAERQRQDDLIEEFRKRDESATRAIEGLVSEVRSVRRDHHGLKASLDRATADAGKDLICGSCEEPTGNVDLYCDDCRLGDLEDAYEAATNERTALRVELEQANAKLAAIRELAEQFMNFPSGTRPHARLVSNCPCIGCQILAALDGVAVAPPEPRPRCEHGKTGAHKLSSFHGDECSGPVLTPEPQQEER